MKKEVTEFLTWPGMYGSGLIAPLMKIGILMFCVAGRGVAITVAAAARSGTTTAQTSGTTTQGFGAPELNFIIAHSLSKFLKIEGNKMITASFLFSNKKYKNGEEKCFYCGLNCDKTYTKEEYVKNTFTNRDIVRYPGSNFICGCCVESLAGNYEVEQIDGIVKNGRAGQPRMYSWLLTEQKREAFTKKHLAFARENILNPPTPPFAIILADSGQKQLIFRAPVNYDKINFVVMLEEKYIKVNPIILNIYLEKAILCSAAIGKIALKNSDEFNNYKNIIEYYGSEVPLVEWMEIYNTPMGELAVWLCPGKKEAEENGNVISRRISQEVG